MQEDLIAKLILQRLATFATANSCPVFRYGNFHTEPGRNAKALYLNVTLDEQHGNRAVYSCEVVLRTAVSADKDRSGMDALSAAWISAADTAFDGFGVVPGGTSYSVDDNFHMKTINYKLYQIGGIQ